MKQPLLFLLVGGFQYVFDAALYALFISIGINTLPANISSRAGAAAAGFLLNRYWTFGQREDTVKRFGASLARFIGLWLVMTLISSSAIVALEQSWGSDNTSRIVAKLLVEAVLAVASFLVSRFWVFRN
jgi:putative flippase GtrA